MIQYVQLAMANLGLSENGLKWAVAYGPTQLKAISIHFNIFHWRNDFSTAGFGWIKILRTGLPPARRMVHFHRLRLQRDCYSPTAASAIHGDMMSNFGKYQADLKACLFAYLRLAMSNGDDGDDFSNGLIKRDHPQWTSDHPKGFLFSHQLWAKKRLLKAAFVKSPANSWRCQIGSLDRKPR